jgi:signal transduction histidine kinase
MSGTEPLPSGGRLPEPEIGIDLNPLASIEIAAGLLAQDDTSAAMRGELVGIVLAECEHLSASIRGVLERFRTAPLHDRQVEVATIVEAAVEEIEFVLNRLGVTVGKDIAPGVPTIQCNPGKIQTLLVWLAISAAESDFARNQIVLHARAADDGVILDVESRGRGSFIRRGVNRLFESRLKQPDVVVYEAVRQCGGRITRSKDLRKGSDFSLWLPLRRDCTNDRWQSTARGGR